MNTRPFARNSKLYFPQGETHIDMLNEGDEFLRKSSKVPYEVIDKSHKMGIMCKHDGRSGNEWFSSNYPVIRLMVIR